MSAGQCKKNIARLIEKALPRPMPRNIMTTSGLLKVSVLPVAGLVAERPCQSPGTSATARLVTIWEWLWPSAVGKLRALATAGP